MKTGWDCLEVSHVYDSSSLALAVLLQDANEEKEEEQASKKGFFKRKNNKVRRAEMYQAFSSNFLFRQRFARAFTYMT